MLDFEVQRCTRRCARSDREFQPGETFYSVLVSHEADVIRRDYATTAWDGPPEDCLGWWKSTMPDSQAKKVNWAPNDVMLHLFEQTAECADKADLRYVLALLLVRRKIARIEELASGETEEVMKLYCPRKETHYEVVITTPSPARAKSIQEELASLLFAEAS